MTASLGFYRWLGLTIPKGGEHKSHVEFTMNNGLVFFLDSKPARWDMAAVVTRSQTPSLGTYCFGPEFYLVTQDALDAS
jgi:hypothetical protein